MALLAAAFAASGLVDLGRPGAGSARAAIGEAVLLEGDNADPAIAGPPRAEPGQWRTRVQTLFDPDTRTLNRRSYTVWDPAPSRGFVFVWQPADPHTDQPGLVSGEGRLVWRLAGRPSYDRSAIQATYVGTMRAGRMEGRGAYLAASGLHYEGDWSAGLMHGEGTLRLQGGDEHVGRYVNGVAHGAGRLTDATGEVYEGPFVEGRRHGRGVTTLPNGRTYASLWQAGRETEASRNDRLAQAPGAGLPGGRDDIRIGIAAERRLYAPRRAEPDTKDGDLWYAITNTPRGLRIEPDDKRLMRLWKGGDDIALSGDELASNFDNFGVASRVRAQLVPLNLIIDVQNRTRASIDLVGVVLDVASSTTDRQPAIQMAQDSAFVDVRERRQDDRSWSHFYDTIFYFENFGWGDAQRARVRFAFAREGQKTAPAELPLTRDLGTISRSTPLDLEPLLREAGVDIALLKAKSKDGGFGCPGGKSSLACLETVKRTGVFGRLADQVTMKDGVMFLGLYGRLDYVWTDAQGQRLTASAPFKSSFPVGLLNQDAEEGEGGNRVLITSRTIELKLDTKGYRLPISYRASVPAGRTSRLVVPIEAARSSLHDFAVVLQLADGREIRSRPIELVYYRPRHFADSQLQFGPQPDPEGKRLDNYDLPGGDLRAERSAVSSYACESACEKDTACAAYVFDEWNNLCLLKARVTQRRFDPKYNATILRGPANPPLLSTPMTIDRYTGKGFKSESYVELRLDTTFEECEARCTAEARCATFTFYRKERQCRFFEAAPAYETVAGADSGVKRQRP